MNDQGHNFVDTGFQKFMKWHVINFLYQPDWAILVKLDEMNMIHLIILSKTQFYRRVKF